MTAHKLISVSVIVLTYKQPAILDLIIQGLNQQTYGGDVEIIITDDGSPDVVVAKNLETVSKSKYSVKYVWQVDKRHRASAARNNGIRIAQNDLLIFLDGDIVPYPRLIEGHAAHHDRPKQLVAGNRTWIGEAGDVSDISQLYAIKPDSVSISRGMKENERRIEWLRSKKPWRVCFSANLSVLREGDIHFDERFVGWGPEDAEFSYRLCVQKDYTPVYDNTIGSFHVESPEAIGNVFRMKKHDTIVEYIRNTLLLYDLCPGLELEDVFFGFPRLELDTQTNRWHIISRPDVYDLNEIVQQTRAWIKNN